MDVMGMFPDYEAIRKEQAEWRKQAKDQFVNGVDPADLKPGAWVTVSPCLRTGDRSYSNELLRVVASNAAHVQLAFETPRSYGAHTILSHCERHFYLADGLVHQERGEAGQP